MPKPTPQCLRPKVNVIARLEFELALYDVTVQYVSHDASSRVKKKKNERNFIYRVKETNLDCCPHLYCDMLKHNVSAVVSAGLQVFLVCLRTGMIQPFSKFDCCSNKITKNFWRSESYQRLKKWYLVPPCLTFSNIRYASRIKWSNPEKGVMPSSTPWCSSYRKGRLQVTLDTSLAFWLGRLAFVSDGVSINGRFEAERPLTSVGPPSCVRAATFVPYV